MHLSLLKFVWTYSMGDTAASGKENEEKENVGIEKD